VFYDTTLSMSLAMAPKTVSLTLTLDCISDIIAQAW